MISHRPSLALIASVFDKVSEADQTRLQAIFYEYKYRAGEAIFLQEDRANAIYLVAEGRVKIERVTPDGHQCILCVRGPGDIFCPVPLLDHGCQLGTAWAMTDVTLLWADRDDFSAACASCSGLLAVVQKDCLLEVRRLLGRMESFSFRNIKERVAFTLLDESQRQAGYGDPYNELRITQQELAGLVGASRESVSRALSKLEEIGAVETRRGRVIIRDRAILQELTQQDQSK